jgi:hypothetical protein
MVLPPMTETDEIFRNEAFDDDTKRAVCRAFNDAWLWLLAIIHPLANTKRHPDTRHLLARRIISAARMGMQNPDQLKFEGLSYLCTDFAPNWPKDN